MDGLGTEIFRAIEGDQHMIAKAAEARQTARPAFQRPQRFGEQRHPARESDSRRRANPSCSPESTRRTGTARYRPKLTTIHIENCWPPLRLIDRPKCAP